MTTVSIDGVLVAAGEARVSIFDRGFLYGDGLFEVLRTWDGALVELDAHLDRLEASARVLGIHVLERVRMRDIVERTVAAAAQGDQRIRIVVTRGPGALAADPTTLSAGTTIVVAEPLGVLPTEISLALVDWPLPRRTGPSHKTLAYLDHLVARDLAAAVGADEAIRLGPDGDVLEGATSNVFVVEDGRVRTPALTGVLPGVTRGHVLRACAEEGIVAIEGWLAVEDLRGADEVFVTSAVRGVVPVTRLDGVTRPAGPLTARIAGCVSSRRRRSDRGSPAI